jgi:hypothetical protein
LNSDDCKCGCTRDQHYRDVTTKTDERGMQKRVVEFCACLVTFCRCEKYERAEEREP